MSSTVAPHAAHPALYVFKPEDGAQNAQSTDPTHVVLFGYMDAPIKHLSKYTDGYRAAYPGATIILVRAYQAAFFRFNHSDHSPFAPIAAYLKSQLPSSEGVLVHIQSNGGCFSFRAVNELLKGNAAGKTGEAKPLLASGEGLRYKKLIMDSCPGRDKFSSMLAAFTVPFAKSFFLVRWAMAVGIASFYLFFRYLYIILRKDPIMNVLCAYMNALPRSTPRLYLYSATDKLVPAVDVEEHAAAAKEQGRPVTMKKFENTAHVAHLRGNEVAYFAAIKSFWDAAS